MSHLSGFIPSTDQSQSNAAVMDATICRVCAASVFNVYRGQEVCEQAEGGYAGNKPQGRLVQP
jgi:hypothetical protein